MNVTINNENTCHELTELFISNIRFYLHQFKRSTPENAWNLEYLGLMISSELMSKQGWTTAMF